MSDLHVSDERMAAVGTIDVRIRSEEYTSDESSFLCTERLDRLQALIDMLCAWGVCVDGNTYTGTGTVAGQFAVGRHGVFFDLIVSTEIS